MIVFDLRCAGDHVFEAWFASSAAFEEQRARRLIACPTCGDDAIEKSIMAPNVAAKGNRAVIPPGPTNARAALAAIQAEMLRRSRWVGNGFADEARAIHRGDKPAAPIHGQASADEVGALIDEGVPVAPLLVPVTPPEKLN